MSEHTFVSRRVTLYDNDGAALIFDVDVDFRQVAEELQSRARHNRSNTAVVAGGAVKCIFQRREVSQS